VACISEHAVTHLLLLMMMVMMMMVVMVIALCFGVQPTTCKWQAMQHRSTASPPASATHP